MSSHPHHRATLAERSQAAASSKIVWLARWLERLADGGIYALLLLIPLIFSPSTVDVLELTKQTALVAIAGIGLLAWSTACLLRQRVQFLWHWSHLIVFVSVLVFGVLALASQDRYLSLVGNVGQMPWSWLTLLGLLWLYVLINLRLHAPGRQAAALVALLLGSIVAIAYGLLQASGRYIFSAGISHATTFTTVGSIHSLAMYAVAILILALGVMMRRWPHLQGRQVLDGRAWVIPGLALLTSVFCLALLILVHFRSAWIAVGFGSVILCLLESLRTRSQPWWQRRALMLPLASLLLSLIAIRWPLPGGLSLPVEVVPSTTASWQIAHEALRLRPLQGAGAGVWMFAYARWHALPVNLSPFWNVRFERGSSAFLTLLPTVGLVGVGLLFLLILTFAMSAIRHARASRADEAWDTFLPVFAAWSTLVFLLFIYNQNFSHQFLFWALLALLALSMHHRNRTWELMPGAALSRAFWFGGIVRVAVIVIIIWFLGQRWLADWQFHQALLAMQTVPGSDQAINFFEQAERLNPWSDAYARNATQAHLARADSLLATPAMAGLQRLQSELAAAVRDARRATELSPGNAENWTTLGASYQRLQTAVASNAPEPAQFALAAYQHAVELEPLNPLPLIEIGKLYLLQADFAERYIGAKNPQLKSQAVSSRSNLLAAAAAVFDRALADKPNDLPARYYLAMVYDKQGRLPAAIQQLEQALSLNRHDEGVAFELAMLYARHEEKNRAVNIFQQIVAADPQQWNARWYLASLLEQIGQPAPAADQLALLAKAFPQNQLIQRHLQTLQADDQKNVAKATLQPLPEPLEDKASSLDQARLLRL